MRLIGVLSVALVVSLVGAYLTYTDETEEVTDEVVHVYTGSETDLQKVAWSSEDLKVTIERRKDDRGEYLWVDSVETKRPKKAVEAHPGAEELGDEADDAEPADGEAPADPAAAPADPATPATPAEPEAPPEVKTTRFLANKQGEDLWKSFAPLTALRELDTTGADKTTFGFEDPTKKASIEVQRAGGPVTLVVGGETYGNKDRYLEYNGKTYLVDDATLRPLQFASSRLIERSLFPYQESDIEKVDVTLPGGKTLSYVQQNRDDRAKAFWAAAAAADKEDEVGGTWLGKVFKLKLKDYVDESTVTTPLEPVLTYSVGGKDGAWSVDIVKTTGETPEWYARSSYNRSLVSLTESLARNVVDDLDTLKGE